MGHEKVMEQRDQMPEAITFEVKIDNAINGDKMVGAHFDIGYISKPQK